MREMNEEVKEEISVIANQFSLMEARVLHAVRKHQEIFTEELRKVKKEIRWLTEAVERVGDQVRDSEIDINGRIYQTKDHLEELLVYSMVAILTRRGFYTDDVLEHMNVLNKQLKEKHEWAARFGKKDNMDTEEVE